MKLLDIPVDLYQNYRLQAIFAAYKWDPQFLDNNTLAKQVLIISETEHLKLSKLTQALAQETIKAENTINQNPNLHKALRLPNKIHKALPLLQTYQKEKHLRLMRFDFHPLENDEYAISEVNSDVPGGFAEASILPEIAKEFLVKNNYYGVDFSDVLIKAIIEKVKPQGRIALVHCTSFSDDRQVMQFLGDKLTRLNYQVIYLAADHLRFKERLAYCILDGYEGPVDAIIRFTPLEWLTAIKPPCWQGYFSTITLSCNYPLAIYCQSKRFPLLWSDLRKKACYLPTWEKLLPETLEVKDVKNKAGYIYKPVFGRIGEKIAIKEACQEIEYQKIQREVKSFPWRFIAQKKFNSKALISSDNKAYHLCLGAFAVDETPAGYYARISTTNRIDSAAADIPVLIAKGEL